MWEVYCLSSERFTTEYYKTEKEAEKRYEEICVSCSLCGKGNYCEATSCEYGYGKVDNF